MWEIRCIVSDKKALDVMTLLDGNTLEPPVMVRVNGPVNGHGPAPARVKINGGSVGLIRQYVQGKKTVNSKQMREHCEANGFSKNGYSYALKKLLNDGELKRTKEPRVYEVTR